MFNEEKIKSLVYKIVMRNNNNPLSPHLQIYRWQISSLLSIAHRIVGVINFLAIILITIGWSLHKRQSDSSKKFIRIALFYGFGLVFLISIIF